MQDSIHSLFVMMKSHISPFVVVSNNFSATSPEMHAKMDFASLLNILYVLSEKDRSVSNCSDCNEVLTANKIYVLSDSLVK